MWPGRRCVGTAAPVCASGGRRVGRRLVLEPAQGQDPQQDHQDHERGDQQDDCGKQALDPRDLQFVAHQAAEALREELAADHHVPARAEDPHQDQDHRQEVEQLPHVVDEAPSPRDDKQGERDEHSQDDLQHDEIHEQLDGNQLAEDLDRFLALVEAVYEIERLQGEVDDDGDEREDDEREDDGMIEGEESQLIH